MKLYYQFMLHGVLDHLEQAGCNIDAFEEDLHKMLMVSGGRRGRGSGPGRPSSPAPSKLCASPLSSFLPSLAPPLIFPLKARFQALADGLHLALTSFSGSGRSCTVSHVVRPPVCPQVSPV